MKKAVFIGLGIVVLAIFGGIWYVSSYISYHNTEIGLKNKFTAKTSERDASFDKMWKIIQSKTQVSENYKDAFIKSLDELQAGRSGGEAFKWVQEANPNLSTALYSDLANSISVERTGFFNTQKELIDLDREHNDLIQKFPGSVFLGSIKPFDLVVITSTKTKEAAKSGNEDDINLNKKQ